MTNIKCYYLLSTEDCKNLFVPLQGRLYKVYKKLNNEKLCSFYYIKTFNCLEIQKRLSNYF